MPRIERFEQFFARTFLRSHDLPESSLLLAESYLGIATLAL
jgi:hypothetical protein